VKRLLVIAFHFPPLAGSSGIQRTLRFVQHLPRHGWQPVVLTPHARAYEAVKPDLLGDIPAGVVVERSFALDASRQLRIAGRYPGWLARPDRWVSWWPGAVLTGRRMIREHRPSAVFSTYPIATAHLIGDSLARASGLPWVADFRDPMAQEGYPADPRTWASFKRVEERVFARAAACTFTAPSAARMYRERYPQSAARIELIENGYDEDMFSRVIGDSPTREPLNPGALTLLHSGIVYPDERDPRHFFAALARVKAAGSGARVRVRFRAPVHDQLLESLAREHGVADMIEVLPHVAYGEALREMLRADALMLLQAANCNEQIPAKLYEYLRAGRPLLAFTDTRGDTAATLRAAGVAAIASLDRVDDIAALIERFAAGDRVGMHADQDAVARGSRQARAERLARLLDDVTAPRMQTRAALSS
jgi:glycosyltransferase involved in cell wall biosynthesis